MDAADNRFWTAAGNNDGVDENRGSVTHAGGDGVRGGGGIFSNLPPGPPLGGSNEFLFGSLNTIGGSSEEGRDINDNNVDGHDKEMSSPFDVDDVVQYPRHPTATLQNNTSNHGNNDHQSLEEMARRNMIVVGVLIALIIVLCCILMFIVLPPIIKCFQKKIPVSKKRIERRYKTIDGWLITKTVQPCDEVCRCLQKYYGRASATAVANRTVSCELATKTEPGEDISNTADTDKIHDEIKSIDGDSMLNDEETHGGGIDAAVDSDNRHDKTPDQDGGISDKSTESTATLVSSKCQMIPMDPFEAGLLSSSDWLYKLGISKNGKLSNNSDNGSSKHKAKDQKASSKATSCDCKSLTIAKDRSCSCDDCDLDRSASSSSSKSSCSKTCCSICLEVFRVGETVSWSTSSECSHVYHHKCIREWLLRKVGCPYCRVVVFLPVDRPTDDDVVANNNRSSDGSQPAFRRRPLTNEALGKLAAERAFRATTTFFCHDCGLIELDGFGDEHWERIRGFTKNNNKILNRNTNKTDGKNTLSTRRVFVSNFWPFCRSQDGHRDRDNDDSDNKIHGSLEENAANVDEYADANDTALDLEAPPRGTENINMHRENYARSTGLDFDDISSSEHRMNLTFLQSLPMRNGTIVQSPATTILWAATTPTSVLNSIMTSSSSSSTSYGETTSPISSTIPFETSSPSFLTSSVSEQSPLEAVMNEISGAVVRDGCDSGENSVCVCSVDGGRGSSNSEDGRHPNDQYGDEHNHIDKLIHDEFAGNFCGSAAGNELALPNLDEVADTPPILGLLQPRFS